MARVSLILLGGFEVWLNDGRTPVLTLKKTQALLAYLALPAGKAHPRDKLAALLWGDMQEPQARAGVRQALFTIRRTLGQPDLVRAEGETVALDPAVVATDVDAFEECAAAGTLDALERAAVLYRGDLLEGLSLQEPPFMEWLLAERLRIHELAVAAFARLLARHCDAGARKEAVQAALRLLALDPLQEWAHRTLMRLHAELGKSVMIPRSS